MPLPSIGCLYFICIYVTAYIYVQARTFTQIQVSTNKLDGKHKHPREKNQEKKTTSTN